MSKKFLSECDRDIPCLPLMMVNVDRRSYQGCVCVAIYGVHYFLYIICTYDTCVYDIYIYVYIYIYICIYIYV